MPSAAPSRLCHWISARAGAFTRIAMSSASEFVLAASYIYIYIYIYIYT